MTEIAANIMNWFRKSLIFIRLCLLLASATLVVACDSLSVYDSNTSGSNKFTGIDEVSLTDGGHLLLSWAAPKDQTSHIYSIRYVKASSLPDSLSATELAS